jgi:hypothetical protein
VRTPSTLDPDVARRRYRVKPHKTSLRPGIDAASINELVDEFEDEAVFAKVQKQR